MLREVKRAVEAERERGKGESTRLIVAARVDSEARLQEMLQSVSKMSLEILQMEQQGEAQKAEIELMHAREAERQREFEEERARERQERASSRLGLYECIYCMYVCMYVCMYCM